MRVCPLVRVSPNVWRVSSGGGGFHGTHSGTVGSFAASPLPGRIAQLSRESWASRVFGAASGDVDEQHDRESGRAGDQLSPGLAVYDDCYPRRVFEHRVLFPRGGGTHGAEISGDKRTHRQGFQAFIAHFLLAQMLAPTSEEEEGDPETEQVGSEDGFASVGQEEKRESEQQRAVLDGVTSESEDH